MLPSLQKLLVILLQAGNNNVEEWLTVSEQIQLATAEAAVRLKQTCKPLVSIFGTPIKLSRDGVLQMGSRIIRRMGFVTANLSPTQKPRKFRHSVMQYGPTDLLWC